MREVTNIVDISFRLWKTIFTDVFTMKHETAKTVPKFLSIRQKQRRKSIVQELLNGINEGLDVNGYESWVYGNDMETKA